MSATDELRAMLDERGVEWRKTPHYSSDSVDNETVFCGEGIEWLAHDHLNGRLGLKTLRYEITPAQAIAATLGDNDATRARQGDAGTCQKVYLVETSNNLLESWFPFGVYLHREAAEDCAEALRKEEDGIRCFARVSELKVVDE